MKNCAYCGRDNADDAVFCRECGTGQFVPIEVRPRSSVNLEAAAPRKRYPIRRHPGLAALFLVVGLVVSIGLSALIIVGNVFSGWGDGSTSRHVEPVGILVMPLASYYVCGVFAAAVANHFLRVIAAMAAHMAALVVPLSFASSRCHGVAFPVALVFGTFVLFGYAWFYMLRETDRAA